MSGSKRYWNAVDDAVRLIRPYLAGIGNASNDFNPDLLPDTSGYEPNIADNDALILGPDPGGSPENPEQD
jgi:hypothetical protein